MRKESLMAIALHMSDQEYLAYIDLFEEIVIQGINLCIQ